MRKYPSEFKYTVRESLKTAIILLLLISLLALTFLMWFQNVAISWENTGFAATMARALGLITPTPEIITLSPAIQYTEAIFPYRIVWTEGGAHWGAQYDPVLTDSAYRLMKASLGTALGSAKSAVLKSEDAWYRALASDNFYLAYPVAISLHTLSLWFSVEEQTQLPDIMVRHLALVSNISGIYIWFIDEENDLFYQCLTELPALNDAGTILNRLLPCRFGFEEKAFERAPLSLLFDKTPTPQSAVCFPVDQTRLVTDAFLSALNINPDTNALFTDQDGTTYFSGTRSCHFTEEYIHYTSPSNTTDDDISINLTETKNSDAIEKSRSLIATLSPALGEARFRLRNAESNTLTGVVTVTFDYELAGLTVHLSDRTPPAVLVFHDGRLVEANVRVLSFKLIDENPPQVPEQMAYGIFARLQLSGDFDLRMNYLEQNGQLLAKWEIN